MLPIWEYLLIAVLGYFSTDTKEYKVVCVFYIIYVLYLYIISPLVSSYLALYFCLRIIPVLYIYKRLSTSDVEIKYLIVLLIVLLSILLPAVIFCAGLFSGDISLIVMSLYLSPYNFEVLTFLLSIIEWKTLQQALFGVSVGLIYLIHFI